MFDFSDSLNDVVPVSPILFSIIEKRREKNELLMDALYLFIFLSPLHR